MIRTARHVAAAPTTFETLADAIPPSVALLLDALLDSAAAARPGVDALVYSDRLRELALETADLASGMAKHATH